MNPFMQPLNAPVSHQILSASRKILRAYAAMWNARRACTRKGLMREFENALTPILASFNATIISLDREPFGFTFEVNGFQYSIYSTKHSIVLEEETIDARE